MQKNKNKFKHLSLEDLISIYEMGKDEKSIRQIAARVKRAVSVVHGVLSVKRTNYLRWSRLSVVEKAEYYLSAKRQQRKSKKSLKRRCKIVSVPGLLEFIVEHLTAKQFSPEQIAGQVPKAFVDVTVTPKTIYNFIKHHRFDLRKFLFERGKPRRQRVMHRRGKLRKVGCPPMVSITERPIEANNRSELGHFEGDTVITKRKGTKAILSLRDRKSRRQFFILVPNLEAKTILEYLIAFIRKAHFSIKTLTFDRGTEFTPSEMNSLTALFGIQIFFCDPYRPEQKGTVENGHRGLRWNYPKGTDFGTLTQHDITHVEEILNKKPMKLLDGVSPFEAFNSEIGKLLAA